MGSSQNSWLTVTRVQSVSRSDLSLSSELLADAVRESSERFESQIPWEWMLETLCVASGCSEGVMFVVDEDNATREVARRVGAARTSVDAQERAGWLRVEFDHGGRVEAVARLATAEPEPLPRWLLLLRPVWAAMIAARQSELRRRATEASYRELFEAAADAIFVADPSLRYIDANARALEVLGYTREALLQRSVPDLVEGSDLRERPLLQEALDRGEVVRTSRPLRLADGRVHWFDLATRRLPNGCYLSVARDVQARRDAEERLRLSEESFRALIEAMPDGIIIHRDGVVRYTNAAVNVILGYPPERSFLGRSVLALLHPDDAAGVAARIRAMSAGQSSVPAREERFIRADGSVLHAEVIAMRSVFQGEPVVVAIGRDRTEDRRIRAELAHADRVGSVGRLAAGVAHEVNNPLTYVMLNLGVAIASLEAMRRGEREMEPTGLTSVIDSLRTVGEGVERVRRIVRDLKTFSRQDDDRAGTVDLHAVIESALNLSSHELLPRARVIREYAPVPRVPGIEGRLCQVFLNLLLNAAQATPQDGVERSVRVRTRVEGAMVRVDIIDEGEGMSPSVRARIFEPFFTTRRGSDGTGLGLSISSDIVRAHGGRIEVQSEPGNGSALSVFLPFAERASVEEEPPPRAPSAPPGRLRVLAIDDEPSVLAAVVRALSGEHSISTAGSAGDALKLLERGACFDVILCDVQMPGMSGVELLSVIRARWPALVSRVTLMVGGASRNAALLLDAEHAVLSKPFDAPSLRDALARAMERGE